MLDVERGTIVANPVIVIDDETIRSVGGEPPSDARIGRHHRGAGQSAEDIRTLENVVAVIKGGRFYKQAKNCLKHGDRFPVARPVETVDRAAIEVSRKIFFPQAQNAVARAIRRQNLERHFPAEGAVQRDVNLSHPARAKQALDFVAAQQSTACQRRMPFTHG
jgi:hypothetical protein